MLPFMAMAAEPTEEFNFEEHLVSQFGQEWWDNYWPAQTYHERLMSFFPKDSAGEWIYPDFIGGIYFSDDGRLVLQLVEAYAIGDLELYSRVEGFLEETDDVVVEYVKFSHNELYDTIDALNAMWLAYDSPEAFENVDGYGDDVSNNRVVMWLAEYNEDEIARFRETVMDSPMIRFEKSQGRPVNLAAESDSIEAYRTIAESIAAYRAFLLIPGAVLLGLVAFFLWRKKYRRTNP